MAGDHFVIDVSYIATLVKELEPTKRNLVSIVGRFYDPLGFVSPVVIQFKIFFQELCRAKLEWDQTLEGEVLQKWRNLTSALEEGSPIIIPRYFFGNISQRVDSYHLCEFCDASKNVYAAVVYLVIETAAGIHVKFVTAKTRVSPLQQQTIPRLELLSAVILAKLMANLTKIQAQLTLSCYTDSQVAFYWIIGTSKEWKQFVQNRVSAIRRLIPITSWNHCVSKDNPADLPSRGLSLKALLASTLWHDGLEWLREKGKQNPTEPQETQPIAEGCIPEMKSKDRPAHSLLVNEELHSLTHIMDCQRYGTMNRLLRVTAYVLRFVNNLRSTNNGDNSHTRALNLVEISEAESRWVKEAQTSLIEHSKFQCWKRQFNLFLDPSGVWRCGGRISNAELPYSAKHPILLPKVFR